VDGESRRTRVQSFVLGGLLGASAALAAARRNRSRHRAPGPTGLAAFEDAPCFRELVEDEERTRRMVQRGGASTP